MDLTTPSSPQCSGRLRRREYSINPPRFIELATRGHVAVDCGNPHLVCPLPAGAELSTLELSRMPGIDAQAFPDGVNVEFVAPGEPVDGADVHVRMRVYERGSAEALSCGSGACAVAAVALRDAGRDAGVVAIDVPGGRLTAALDGATCWLAGPAVLVAHGEVDFAAL